MRLLELLQNITSLTIIHLHSNPWSCHQCSVLPLLKWVRQSPLYSEVCGLNYESSTCLRCASPLALEGRTLHSLKKVDLEPCSSLFPQSQTFEPSSNIPAIAAASAAVVVVLVILSAIICYNRQGAVYYTKEGERTPTLNVLGLTTSECTSYNGGSLPEDKRRTYFVTLDRIDEYAQEKVVATRSRIYS